MGNFASCPEGLSPGFESKYKDIGRGNLLHAKSGFESKYKDIGKGCLRFESRLPCPSSSRHLYDYFVFYLYF